MVMPYYEGPTLKAALAELGHVPSEGELRTWLKPILNAVTVLHEGGTWHQNIGPDEIVLTPIGPVLLGFAAAAHAIEAIHHTPAAALKPGFAGDRAVRQRGRHDARPVDRSVRARCRDLRGDHRHRAGGRRRPARQRPAAAARRRRGRPLQPGFLAAIDAAMAVQPKQRPADHTEFRALMGDIEAPESGLARAAARPDAGAFRRHAGERARDHGARPARCAAPAEPATRRPPRSRPSRWRGRPRARPPRPSARRRRG